MLFLLPYAHAMIGQCSVAAAWIGNTTIGIETGKGSHSIRKAESSPPVPALKAFRSDCIETRLPFFVWCFFGRKAR
jgi:hypothetical protein